MKPSLSWTEQVALLVRRGLVIEDHDECADFLASHNYYRFSGYMRYFQKAPHEGDDDFVSGTTLAQIRAIYDADHALRAALTEQLANVELLLRTHTAHVIADNHGPCGRFLTEQFYTDATDSEPTVYSCLKDIRRSRERHILRYAVGDRDPDLSKLPVWSAVEAWSFGTLSRCIERGAQGDLSSAVAESMGAAQAGFAYRVRAMVYVRNRCAHHGRIGTTSSSAESLAPPCFPASSIATRATTDSGQDSRIRRTPGTNGGRACVRKPVP